MNSHEFFLSVLIKNKRDPIIKRYELNDDEVKKIACCFLYISLLFGNLHVLRSSFPFYHHSLYFVFIDLPPKEKNMELVNLLDVIVHPSSSFFSVRFVSVHMVHPYSSIDTTAALEKLRFQAAVVSILLYRCTTSALTKRMEKKT